MKHVGAVVAAAIALFVWGFLFWGATKLPYQAWTQTADDGAAQLALREHFPANGVYAVPGMQHEEAELNRLYEQGPVGFVTITAIDGRAMMVPSVMALGFVHCLVTAALLAMMLTWLAPGVSFLGKMKVCGWIGLIVAFYVMIGDAIWWMLPWPWQLVKAFYTIAAFKITGAVLAWLLPKPAAAA